MKPIRFAAVLFVLLSASVASAQPDLTEDQQRTCISLVKNYTGVRDAAITQDGARLSLVLVVDASMGADMARKNGERFVRMVKHFGPDDNPASEVGPGMYDYLIGVYTPAKKKVAMGAKARNASKITW